MIPPSFNTSMRGPKECGVAPLVVFLPRRVPGRWTRRLGGV
ncbi:MAG: hypothetical protein ACO2O2_16680 [Acidilobaceae archaeon]